VSAAALVEATLRDALGGADEACLVSRLCERLVAVGVPLTRMAVACDMLDPSFDSHGVRWRRGEGAMLEDYDRTPSAEAEDEWLGSPFYALVTTGDRMLRRRLDGNYRPGEFRVLDEFKASGATDYLCLVERIDDALCFGVTRGVVASWCAEGEGFDDATIATLGAVMPAFSTAFLARTILKTTRALLGTYLGEDAAARVLAGNVIRGRAERLRAVVWFADLVGFTRVADTHAGEAVLAMLNAYAERRSRRSSRTAATCSSSWATAFRVSGTPAATSRSHSRDTRPVSSAPPSASRSVASTSVAAFTPRASRDPR
jgi:adenylate cyclase